MELAGPSRDEPLLDGEFVRPRVTRSGSALSAVADRVTDNEYNANHESTFALVFTYFKTGTANFLGSFVVFGRMILNSDTIVGCLVAVFAVAYFHNTYPSYKPSHLSWSVVSMAIIFPISHGITMSFGRREKAGAELGSMLGDLRAIYGAVHSWTVPSQDGTGFVRMLDNFENPTRTQADIRELFSSLLTTMDDYFGMPRWSDPRHLIECLGAAEQEQLELIAKDYRLLIDSKFFQIQRMIQSFKEKGLPGGEAHRLDQYISLAAKSFEALVIIKEYRTPHSFRAFARACQLLLPILFGPYYTTVADQSSLEYAIIFACCIQIAIASLYRIMMGLEDIFTHGSLQKGHNINLGHVVRSSVYDNYHIDHDTDYLKISSMLRSAREQLHLVERNASKPWSLD